MDDVINSLAVIEPGDSSQVEVIAGDARLCLEQAWGLLNTDTPPDVQTAIEVQALVVTAHKRVEQLELMGEVALAAVASIRAGMAQVEKQRDEAVNGMVEAEEKVAEIVSEIDARVERQVEMEMEYAEENLVENIDWAELRHEAEEMFDNEVEWIAMRLKGLGETEAAEDMEKKLREAKRMLDEVGRLAEQHARFANEKEREHRQQEWAERHPGAANNPYDHKPVAVEDDEEDDETDPAVLKAENEQRRAKLEAVGVYIDPDLDDEYFEDDPDLDDEEDDDNAA